MDEIRYRALDNLISKLDTTYSFTESDLVQNKDLFIKLFELFNYPHFTRKECVLKLLIRLAKVNIFFRSI